MKAFPCYSNNSSMPVWQLIDRALKAIRKDYMAAENTTIMMTSPSIFVDYLKLQFIDHEREHFGVIFLNNQNQVISTEKLFSGTLNHVEVHSRVIARKALLHREIKIAATEQGKTITAFLLECYRFWCRMNK